VIGVGERARRQDVRAQRHQLAVAAGLLEHVVVEHVERPWVTRHQPGDPA
jgi:hypothetical protein